MPVFTCKHKTFRIRSTLQEYPSRYARCQAAHSVNDTYTYYLFKFIDYSGHILLFEKFIQWTGLYVALSSEYPVKQFGLLCL